MIADMGMQLEAARQLTYAAAARSDRVVAGERVDDLTFFSSAGKCLASGVGIGKILTDGPFGEVSVPPAPGDSGTAIGAALAAHHALTGIMPAGPVGGSYLGPAYPHFTPAALPPGLSALQVPDPANLVG